MSIFKITIKAGTPAVFDPNPQIVFVNDSVFWHNDDQQAHWPAPILPANPPAPLPLSSNPTKFDQKGFIPFQIAPNTSSNQVSFGSAQTIHYGCTLHLDKNRNPLETGVIIVKSAKKSAFGGKTKKGAFAKKTKKGAFAKKTKKGAFAKQTKKGALAEQTKKGAFGRVTTKPR
ncbi:MAG: hypothetical protein ACJ754_19390 [Pyrinomonadaceae bacterium]